MYKNIILLLICVVLKSPAQDTLFLKNGEKFIVNIKTIKFDLTNLKIKTFNGVQYEMKEFYYASMLFISTKDTFKLLKIQRKQPLYLNYFRMKDSTGNYVEIKLNDTDDLRNKLEFKENYILRNFAELSIGSGLMASGRESNAFKESIGINSTFATNLEYKLKFDAGFGLNKYFGFGGNLSLDRQRIDFYSIDKDFSFYRIMATAGPFYRFRLRNTEIRAKLYVGLNSVLSNFDGAKNNNSKLTVFNENKFVINPEIDIIQHLSPNLYFKSNIQMQGYQTNFKYATSYIVALANDSWGNPVYSSVNFDNSFSVFQTSLLFNIGLGCKF